MRWGAIRRSSRSPLTAYPACLSIADPRTRPFSSISRLPSPPDFLLHRYIDGWAATAFPHAAEMAGLRAQSAATVLSLAVLIGTGIAFSLREGRLTSSLAALAVAAALAAAGAAIFIRRCNTAGGGRSPQALFVLFSGAEILWRNAASSLNAEPLERYSLYAGMKPADAAGIEALRQDIAARHARAATDRASRYLGSRDLGRMRRWSSSSKIRSATIPCASTITNARSDPGQDAEDFALRRYPGTFRGYNSRLAALLGLEYLVLDRPLTELPREIPRPKARNSSQATGCISISSARPRRGSIFPPRSSRSTMKTFSTNMCFRTSIPRAKS